MANYDVNLDVKVRAQQLRSFNNDLIKTNNAVRATSEGLLQIEKGIAKGVTPSLSNLNRVLSNARSNFNQAARGTFSYGKSLIQLAQAEKALREEQSKSTFDLNQARKRANKTERDAEAARLRRLREERRLRKQINQERAIAASSAQVEIAVRNNAAFGVLGGQIGPALAPNMFNRAGFGANAQGGPFAMPGGAMGRLKGGIGSALIGGGFPLLFGAGGLSSVLGGLAGGVGGALAPGGGFAASIAATAIAAQITKAQEFDKAIKKLNKSIAATGNQSQFTASQIREFAKSMDMTKEEALEALKAFEQFGAAARVSLLKVFGDEATFGMLANLKDNAAILSQMDQITKNLGFEQAGLVLEILKTQGARAAENKILELTIKKNKELNMQIKERAGAEGRLRQIRKQQRAEEELKVQKDIQDAKILLDLQIRRTEEERKQAIIKAPVDELNKLLDPLYQVDALGKSIGASFSESFKGIVTGSMTAQGALRNLFSRTADHFLDMAAQILAAQIRSGIFGLFSNLLTSPIAPTPFNPAPGTFGTNIPSGANLPAGSFNVTPRPRLNRGVGLRAGGGPVMAGGSYIVGERGPEMFSPGVSGMITPNHALGGSTNIVVNVDASGSSVEGDEEQGRELGRMISVAIQSELIKQKRPGGMLA